MTTLPSLELLRHLSDRTVLDALLADGRLTRAEIAARTSLSKPTVSESMRRLAAAGLAEETGERSSGRGRSGAYFAVPATAGAVLAIDAKAGGVGTQMFDLGGRLVHEERTDVGAPVRAATLAAAMRAAVETALTVAPGPVLTTTVSVGDPVDRVRGRAVQLPDVPFLVGDLAPGDALAGLAVGELGIDNDVNWAAVAEHREGIVVEVDDLVYGYLGDGVGAAVILDGRVRRGHRGLAGEIMHVAAPGPDGRIDSLVRCLVAYGITRPDSTAVDTEAVVALFADRTRAGQQRADRLVSTLSSVFEAVSALVNPEVIVLGGTWHQAGGLSERLAGRLAEAPVPCEVRVARVAEASARGAALDALDRARGSLLRPPS